jgi:hypothetical protein
VPALRDGPRPAIAFFERDGWIADLDDMRAGRLRTGEVRHRAAMAARSSARLGAGAADPLRTAGRRGRARAPRSPRRFDWEDFDLLRVVGQQLASYLAENAGQEALAEASRFDDFHRRIAFVMHDIKNLASQLSLLARNAELHAEKPEFRADMLVTLRNSADKLNALLIAACRAMAAARSRDRSVDAGAVDVVPGGRALRRRHPSGHAGELRRLHDRGQCRIARTGAGPPDPERGRCQRAGRAGVLSLATG